MSQNISKKRGLKLVLIFVGVAIFTLLLIMAVAYIRQRFSGEGGDSGHSTEESETIEKNDDKTISMRYSGYITVRPDEGLITLYFENPIRSRKSVALKIVGEINGEEVTFASVDKLLPGEKVESVEYKLNKKIESGKYTGKFVLNFYDENGNEEIVNSNAAIDVIVK